MVRFSGLPESPARTIVQYITSTANLYHTLNKLFRNFAHPSVKFTSKLINSFQLAPNRHNSGNRRRYDRYTALQHEDVFTINNENIIGTRSLTRLTISKLTDIGFPAYTKNENQREVEKKSELKKPTQ